MLMNGGCLAIRAGDYYLFEDAEISRYGEDEEHPSIITYAHEEDEEGASKFGPLQVNDMFVRSHSLSFESLSFILFISCFTQTLTCFLFVIGRFSCLLEYFFVFLMIGLFRITVILCLLVLIYYLFIFFLCYRQMPLL